tara:strand:- start:157 stop:759 length:603 start_codon:yes stop_codon:yes gene_type:complete
MANYDGLSRNAWPGTWSTNGTHPITLDTEQRGGLRLVSGSGTDTLVGIPSGMLQDGMLAYVGSGYHADISTGKYYKYSVLSGESRNTSTGFLPNNSGNWSEFTTGGSSTRTYNNVTANFSMSASSDVVFLDTTSGPINVYLPTAAGNGGKELMVKLKAGSNSGVLVASGSQTIDGQSAFPIHYVYQNVTLISDNSNWFIT